MMITVAKCNICGKDDLRNTKFDIDGYKVDYEYDELAGRRFVFHVCESCISNMNLSIFSSPSMSEIVDMISLCSIVPEGYYDGIWVQYTPEECQMMWDTKLDIMELVEYPRFIELADIFGEGEISPVFQRRFPIEFIEYKKQKDYQRAVHYAVVNNKFYAYELETGNKFESKNYHTLTEFFSTFENSRYIIAQVH